MSIIEDAARLRNAELLRQLNDCAQEALGGPFAFDVAEGVSPRMRTEAALCLLVGVVADQQSQIQDLREHLRRLR